MSAQEIAHPARSYRNGDYERFVAFAFAGANMVAEINAEGTITYAAGALHPEFGRGPEQFVGEPVRSLVAPVDHETLDMALSMLVQRGRLRPMTIRLANPQQTRLAIAGLALPLAGRAPRLCLTFAVLPLPATTVRTKTAHALARATEARLRGGARCNLGLIEIVAPGGAPPPSNETLGSALEAVAPDTLAGEVAPGRFGLLGSQGDTANLLEITALLEKALQSQGVEVTIASRHLPLETEGLTPIQAARAAARARCFQPPGHKRAE